MTDGSAARRYHEATKHSFLSVRRGRGLDWANQPIPYKIYTSLSGIPLPPDGPPTTMPALDAIGGQREQRERTRPDLADLARLCRLSNGITRRRRWGGQEFAFRAAGTTGALYHVELYLITGDVPGLDAGVYHFGAHDDALRQLRAGDLRSVVVEASGEETSTARAPVMLAATSAYWRNAWKYEARAYRHSFWDAGTVLANLLAVATALGLPALIVLGWADDPVSRLLDVDPDREGVIALVALGADGASDEAPSRQPAAPIEPVDLPTASLSPREERYEEIGAAHRAAFLPSGAEARAWREAARGLRPEPRPSSNAAVPLEPLAPEAAPTDPIETVIRRRGSTRRFSRRAIGFDLLSTIVDAGMAPITGDCTSDGPALGELFLIVNAVESLEPGLFVVDAGRRSLEPLSSGQFRRKAGVLALGQDVGAEAAVNAYFLADLEPVLDTLGNRGYRAAQLSCAVASGRMWLAAYALGLGATGLTFFDDPVVELFSPHAAGMDVMFLLTVGQPA